MNRRGDCICAIPAKPPEEHNERCPVRVRASLEELAKRTGVRPSVFQAGLAGMLDALGIAHPIGDARELYAEAAYELAQDYLRGAGADQAPGEGPDARESATRRAAAPARWLPPPSLPNQPLGVAYRFSVDGSCLCVTLEVRPWLVHKVKPGRYAHPDCRASHDAPAVGVCTEAGPEVLDPRVMPDAPPFAVGAWAPGHEPPPFGSRR